MIGSSSLGNRSGESIRVCAVDPVLCAINNGMSTVDRCVREEWLIHIFQCKAVEQGEYTVSLVEIVVYCKD